MRNDPRAAGEPRPFRPRLGPYLAYAASRLVRPNPFYRRLAGLIERHPRGLSWFTAGERVAKEQIFGCQMCGQCALPATGYTCPMTCPKQLRNGPCGGVSADGRCEVYPSLPCAWVVAFERAERTGHGRDLDLYQRPVDHRESGRSSWVNYWLGRDDGLWGAAGSPDGRPQPGRELPVLSR